MNDSTIITKLLPNGLIIELQISSTYCWIETIESADGKTICGNAEKATERKIRSFCIKTGLECYRNCIQLYSKKDTKRLKNLIQYIGGKKFAKTARNNNRKRTH